MQEVVGVETKIIQFMTKIVQIMEHYVSTDLGVSKEFYGGRRSTLDETGQGNAVSVSTCRDSSCMTLKGIEKENLGVFITLPLTKDSVQQLEMSFVDDNYFSSDEKKVIAKMAKTLNKHTHLCEVTAGRVQFDKTHF